MLKPMLSRLVGKRLHNKISEQVIAVANPFLLVYETISGFQLFSICKKGIQFENQTGSQQIHQCIKPEATGKHE
jgi:hypothetical protein